MTQLGTIPQHVTTHLDTGYDSGVTSDPLTGLRFTDEISRKGTPAPIRASKRWVVDGRPVIHNLRTPLG